MAKISGLAFMGIYPSVNANIEMTPVDYASRACIFIRYHSFLHPLSLVLIVPLSSFFLAHSVMQLEA